MSTVYYYISKQDLEKEKAYNEFLNKIKLSLDKHSYMYSWEDSDDIKSFQHEASNFITSLRGVQRTKYRELVTLSMSDNHWNTYEGIARNSRELEEYIAKNPDVSFINEYNKEIPAEELITLIKKRENRLSGL